MTDLERNEFLRTMGDTIALLRQAQGALRIARLKCHGALYERIDVFAKRLYELGINAEWTRELVLGRLSLESGDGPGIRKCVDRRRAIDPRVVGMRKQLAAVR